MTFVGARLLLLLLVLMLCSQLTACDPGYKATPVGWAERDGSNFETIIDGLQFRTTRIGGLLGESSIDVDFVITNASHPVRLQKIVLTSRLGKFNGVPAKWPWRFTNADIRGPGRAYFGAYWNFDHDKALPDIIGEQVEMDVYFLYGGAPRHFAVIFRK